MAVTLNDEEVVKEEKDEKDLKPVHLDLTDLFLQFRDMRAQNEHLGGAELGDGRLDFILQRLVLWLEVQQWDFHVGSKGIVNDVKFVANGFPP